MKIIIFQILLILSFYNVIAQNTFTLRGKVVELKDNKTVGVPGVVVSVSGESYDITAADGSFKLIAPAGLDFVTVTIKGAPSAMISPYEGKVNLPPQYEPIEIKLCNENNAKLFAKINALNNKIRSLKQNQKLSSQQVERMQRTMVDTIIFYQSQAEGLKIDLANASNENQLLNEKITKLESQNAELEQKLFAALGEKYKNQYLHFEMISTELNSYLSRLKDLHHVLPTDAVACATNTPSACDRFYNTIEKYNLSRNFINDHKDEHLLASSQYWSEKKLSTELKAVYTFILQTIHDPLLFTKMNQTIMDVIKQRSLGNISMKTTKKLVSTASKELANELQPLITKLEESKSKLFFDFNNSIQ